MFNMNSKTVVLEITSLLYERIFLHTESWKYIEMASNALLFINALLILFNSRCQLTTLQALSQFPPAPAWWGGESQSKSKFLGWDKNNLIVGKKYNSNNNNCSSMERQRE